MQEATNPAVGDELSSAERERYSRHLLVPEIGVEGQWKLKASRVLLVGLGGLGCPSALYLAAAGVGTIGLVEFDQVDLTNLQRQILFDTGDVGRPKIEVAAQRLRELNPLIQVVPYPERLTAQNAASLISKFDLVLDGSDNFNTRYLVNDACVFLNTPNIHGSIYRFEGQVSVFVARGGPCYRCLFPVPPGRGEVPSCAEAGVLGILPGLVGLLQATEAVKLLLGIGDPLIGRLLSYDALAMKFREIKFARLASCPVCGEHPSITELREEQTICETPTEGGTPSMSGPAQLTVEELKARIDKGEKPMILDVRNPEEFALCQIPGAKLIPLGELPQRVAELDPGQEIIVHCKLGGRSSQAQAFLMQQGFRDVKNLSGGIIAWADRIDPSIQRY